MPVTQRPAARPYRDFLTPSLHRRFTNAALLTIALCYLEACWMGEWDLFWHWFPLGPTGIRTLLLFVPALSVCILRVAKLHIGLRTTTSSFGTFWRAFGFGTIQTFVLYTLMAWLFSVIYMTSTGPEANFSVIERGRPYERERLNERPIYMQSMFICLGFAQAIVHLYKDEDRVRLPVMKIRNSLTDQLGNHGMVLALTRLKEALPKILKDSIFRICIMSVLGPVLHITFLNRITWQWNYGLAYYYLSFSRAANLHTFPSQMADLMGRFFVEGLLLLFLWEFCNKAFEIFVSQEPLKNSHLLTDDSKDPNGSLISGLKAKKEVPRNIAFWELVIIAYHYPTRRGSLFQELDRKGGSTYAQVLTVCLGELHAMVKRIQDFQNPPVHVPPPSLDPKGAESLPKISQPLKENSIFVKPSPAKGMYEKTEAAVSEFAKAHGQSPGAADPITPRAKKLLTHTADAMLTKQKQDQFMEGSLSKQIQGYAIQFLGTPFGYPFRMTFERLILSVVLGTPFGRLESILDATTAISKLAVCSIKDDPYGKVYQTIPTIIRVFVSSITTLENFVKTQPAHWTDVAFKPEAANSRRVYDVDLILSALRGGLRDLVNEFGEYAEELGLSRADIRIAKEVVAAGSGNMVPTVH